MAKPRIVYIHGDGHLYWSFAWAPWLKHELERAGYRTFFELFPDSIEARAKYWLAFLSDHVQAGEDDVLVGWSSGTLAALRHAEKHKLRGLVLIAPYHTDLGLEKEKRSGYFDQPWRWDDIRRNAGRVAVFASDADPYISQAEFTEVARQLGTEVRCVPGAGHFAEQEEFSELSEYIRSAFP
jgi:predicted alpha/beta hydrolase family esterase